MKDGLTPIYIEAGDEITTVIERMKQAEGDSLALVIPKGALLLQSIVNLKLARKAAAEVGKALTLVTTDKIGRNLASQIGVPVVTKLDGVDAVPEEAAPGDEPQIIAGVKIHRYYEHTDEEREAEENQTGQGRGSVPPIIPREIMRSTGNEGQVSEEEENPIRQRQLDIDTAGAPTPKNGGKPAVVEVVSPANTDAMGSPKVLSPATAIVPPPSTENEDNQEHPLHESRVGRIIKPAPHPRRRRNLLFLTYLLILLLLGSGAAAAFSLPISTATIHLASEPYTQDLTVVAKVGSETVLGSGSDPLTLPAELLTITGEGSVDFTATGSKDVGTMAKGTAKIFNSYSSSPQALPAGAVLSANGRTFTTDAALTVPGAQVIDFKPVPGSATIAISATQSGEESNLTDVAATITSPASNLYGQIVSTTGGTSKKVTIITQNDITTARTAVTKKIQEDAAAKMKEEATKRSLTFNEGSDVFNLESFSPSAPAGSEADRGTVTGKGTLKRLVVTNEALQQTVQNRLQAAQDSSRILTLSNISVTSITQSAPDTLTLQTTSTGNLHPVATVGSLHEQLTGKSESVAKDTIKNAIKGVESVDITRRPAWWPLKNLPFSAKFITVKIAE